MPDVVPVPGVEDMMDEREERIRARAHQLWEEEGRPDGRAEHHWFLATEIIAVEESRAEAPEPIEALQADPVMDPNVRMEPGGDIEPVSEIDTIRRTLEVPKARRTAVSPAGDPIGALAGDKTAPSGSEKPGASAAKPAGKTATKAAARSVVKSAIKPAARSKAAAKPVPVVG